MSDNLRDGDYPGPYLFGNAYHQWMALRGQIAASLQRDPATIWYFFLAGHIGDHVSGLTAIGAFKRERNHPPVAVISSGPTDLHDLFAHCADIFAATAPWDLATVFPLTRFQPGYPFIVEPHYYADGRLFDLFPICTFMDLCRYQLRLPMGAPLVPPRVPESARAAAAQAFARAGLAAGRTVLLAPHANSAPRMPIAWWAEVAEHLKRRGMIPVTNVPNHFGRVQQEQPIPGTMPIDVPLAQVIPFVELAGHFMAVAQGLCDLVAFAQTRLKVIYTPCHFLDGLRPEDGASSTGGYSLTRMYGITNCEMYDLPTDAPFDPAILDGWP